MNFGPGPCDRAIIEGSAHAVDPCRSGTWVLTASILGSSMAFIDGSAVNVALPALQSSLHATLTQVQWVVEAYTLFLGALILTGGSLGDLWGHARVFSAGTILFAAGSIWCGCAPDIHHLIVARGVQGVGAAMLVPTSLALLSVYFPRDRVGTAIGIWSGATAVTSAVGPLLGGWLAQHASWRWVFFINVPISIAVLVIVAARVPNRGPTVRGRIDYAGTFLAAIGLGGIVYGLLQSVPWVGVVGGLALAGFLVAEGRERNPMLPLGLFRSGDFTGSSLLTLFLYGALSGAFFFFPLELVQGQGYSETAAGEALIPFIVLMAGLSRWSATLLDRFPASTVLLVGPLVAGAGFAGMALPGNGTPYWTGYLPATIVLGLGMAITVAPLTTTVMKSVGEAQVGIASGVNNAISRVAGLITIALMGLILKAVAVGFHGTAQEGFLAGFKAVMWVSAGLAVLAGLSSLVFIRSPSGEVGS